jgi:hypothetical protein
MSLENHDLSPVAIAPRGNSLAEKTEAELLELRQQIDRRLNLDLADLNLTQELVLQFKQAKNLLDDILDDSEIASNQKSAVLNSATSILSAIAKAQEQIYSAERLKTIEAATIKALKTLPLEAQEAFFSLYGKYLSGQQD